MDDNQKKFCEYVDQLFKEQQDKSEGYMSKLRAAVNKEVDEYDSKVKKDLKELESKIFKKVKEMISDGFQDRILDIETDIVNKELNSQDIINHIKELEEMKDSYNENMDKETKEKINFVKLRCEANLQGIAFDEEHTKLMNQIQVVVEKKPDGSNDLEGFIEDYRKEIKKLVEKQNALKEMLEVEMKGHHSSTKYKSQLHNSMNMITDVGNNFKSVELKFDNMQKETTFKTLQIDVEAALKMGIKNLSEEKFSEVNNKLVQMRKLARKLETVDVNLYGDLVAKTARLRDKFEDSDSDSEKTKQVFFLIFIYYFIHLSIRFISTKVTDFYLVIMLLQTVSNSKILIRLTFLFILFNLILFIFLNI